MLNDWACVRIQMDERDKTIFEGPCAKSLEDFQTHLKSKGITAETNNNHDDLFLTVHDYEFDGLLDKFFRSSLEDYKVRFLLVVLPQQVTSKLYNHIKRYGDIKYGIHTVCVKADKFGSPRYDDNVALVSATMLSFQHFGFSSRISASVYEPRRLRVVSESNICDERERANFRMVQKINLKLGGTNHVLDDNSYGFIFQGKTMVVGIDVTHPPPGNDGAPSVAAMVASRDKELSQWPADLRINARRQEMVNLLQEMLVTRLRYFKEKNSEHLPENILIYRDGVGEGQYKTVLEEELPRLRAACHQVYGTKYEPGIYPRISLIVVGKRHHTRFYRTDGAQGGVSLGRSGNPECGTVSTLHNRRR